jgi:catechol 2,3-dioxygenase-like lactoylglutathione lyase family enzyme
MAVPTTGRVQLALNVSDLEESIAFYSKLLDAEPAKRKPGYANFATDTPPLKLVLIESDEGGSIDHLGVEVADTDQVESAIGRIAATGLATDVEESDSCCYALQDKVWVTARDGERWEYYAVLDDVEVMPQENNADSCCAEGEVAVCS